MNTSKIKLSIIALLLLAAVPFALCGDGPWRGDWQKALPEAAKNKQPVLIDFYTDWCPPCKKLAAETFVDPVMLDYFKKENYVLLKVNPEKDRVAEAKFKVYGYPTLVVFKPDGSELDRMLGFLSTKDLILKLNDLKKGIGTLDDLLGKLKKFKAEDTSEKKFKLMFDITSKYIAKADFQQALDIMDRVIRLDKKNQHKQATLAMRQKGHAYYKWKKFKEAIEAQLAIHKAFPGTPEAQAGYATAAFYAGKMKDDALALKLHKELVKLYPDGPAAKRSLKKIKKLEAKLGN